MSILGGISKGILTIKGNAPIINWQFLIAAGAAALIKSNIFITPVVV
jgi:hypothetical protein